MHNIKKPKPKSITRTVSPRTSSKRNIAFAIKRFFKLSPAVHTDVYSGSVRRYNGVREVSKNANSSNIVPSRRYNPNNRPFWKYKKQIIAACVLTAIVIAIISVSIPGENNNIYASYTSPTSGVSETPVVSQTSAVSEPSAVVYSGISSEKLEYLQQSGLEWASSALSGGREEIETATVPVVNNTPDVAPSDSPSVTPIPTNEIIVPELVPGTNDSKIIEIQQRLMELGYMEEDEATDYYGWGTEYSLQLFQRKHGLQIDGLIGEETLSKLFSDDAVPYTVKAGDRGTDVEALQDRLQELKYLKTPSSGYYGTDTEKAVKSFQKRNGLSADGTVGENTREALFSKDAKPAAKPSSGGSGGSGGTGGSGHVEVGDPDQASVDKLIEIAESLLGSKYVRGGKGPNTFDCSGFVYYCLNKAGREIGYMTSTDWAKSNLPKISDMSDLKPGDILCFSPHHVGIYIGDGQMIDASSGNGKVVKRSCTSSYWKSHFRGARRVL